MFVVLGATGHTGSMVANTLLAQQQPVRVVVRSAEKGAMWKAKGAEFAVASLDDVVGLTKAFEGAKGLYLMVPSNYGATDWLTEQQARMNRAAEAVKKSGISQVLYSSSIGAQFLSGTGPIRAVHYGEKQLARVTANLTSPSFVPPPSWRIGYRPSGWRRSKGCCRLSSHLRGRSP